MVYLPFHFHFEIYLNHDPYKNGEKFSTLDGNNRKLKDFHLLICDAEKPVALANVSGDPDDDHVQGAEIILNGSASDDTDVKDIYGGITYLWVPPIGIELSNSTVEDPLFIAPQVGDSQDTLNFILVVNDGEFDSNHDSFTQTIYAVNDDVSSFDLISSIQDHDENEAVISFYESASDYYIKFPNYQINGETLYLDDIDSTNVIEYYDYLDAH